MTANGYKLSFQGDETSLELVGMVARPLNTPKTTELSTLKLLNSMVCDLYLNF